MINIQNFIDQTKALKLPIKPACHRVLPSDLPPIKSWQALSDEKLVALPVVLEGLIHKGTKVSLYGSSKTCKTWVVLDLAISIAHGIPWLGIQTTKGKVLYINFELKEASISNRLRVICEKLNRTPNENLKVWTLRGLAADASIIIPRIIDYLRDDQESGDDGYSLIVIDPLYKLLGSRDENSATDIGALLNEFEKLTVDTGAAVLIVGHNSKGNQAGKEAVDRISGSGVFARDPDTILPITAHAEDNAFVIEPILRDFPPVEPFSIRWEYPLMHRDLDLDPSNLKGMKSFKKHSPSVEEFMNIFPNTGKTIEEASLTIQEIDTAFKERGWKISASVTMRMDACKNEFLEIITQKHNRKIFVKREVSDAIKNARILVE